MQTVHNESKAQLFMLPFAGGSVYAYGDWKKQITDDIEICYIELAGRGKRMEESFYESLEDAVEDVYKLFKQEYKGGNYYIFGHSMGSLIAFELYYMILSRGDKLPEHLFLSGRNPPDLCKDIIKVGNYDDMDFLNEVAKYGAVPRQLFMDDEVRKVFLPILRADFKMIEEHECKKPILPIDCDISIFWGRNDFSTDVNKIMRWREYGKKEVTIIEFLGGHFFLADKVNNARIIQRVEEIYQRKKRTDIKMGGIL